MTSNRNIFEDVSGAQPDAPKPSKKSGPARRAIAAWLAGIFALVVAILVVGGLARLAITEMAIPAFSFVALLVWGIGFLWFWLRKAIPIGWAGRLLGLGLLVGLHSVAGWWAGLPEISGAMVGTLLVVQSGLAFLILGLVMWYLPALRMGATEVIQARRQRQRGLVRLGTVLVVLLFLQVLLGALLAGLDAGRGYTDWPLMQGAFLPVGSFDLAPLWRNFFENPGLVQWNHRMLGYLVALVAVLIWWKSRASALNGVKRWHVILLLAVAGQVVLGIITVLYAAQAHIAMTHLLGAVFTFAIALRARFEAAYPAPQKIARA